MSFFQRGGRGRFILVLLVLTAVSLMTLDGRGVGPVDTVRSTAMAVLSPFRSAAGWVLSPVANIWNGITDYSDLKEENAELRRQLAEREGAEIREITATETLQRYLRDTEIDFAPEIPQVTGRVTAGPSTPFEATVTIDKGSDHGVKEGMAVVNGAGLVGRIERVTANESVVLLITDARVNVAARMVSNDALGLIEGRGVGRSPEFAISGDVDLVADDIVQTSGLANSQYPPGVPIGRLVSVPDRTSGSRDAEADESEGDADSDSATSTTTGEGSVIFDLDPVTTFRAEVELAARLDRLHFLTVLLWEGP